ncbi:Ankyrin repeat protein [Rickettsiales bacterium Ac37b]|nr:Ankyrin repeat protein [Rickettsiales bacterium Ac37b]
MPHPSIRIYKEASLDIAAKKAGIKKIKLFLSRGGDVNAKAKDGKTLLHYALINNQIGAVKFLVSKGADINAQDKNGRVPLHYAAINQNVKAMEFLLDHGANVNAINIDKETILHIVAGNNDPEAMKLLVSKGADVNIINIYKESPLHIAVSKNNIKAVELLLNSNANANVLNKDQKTPLHIAAKKNFIKLIKLLLNKDAHVNCIDSYGRTPLYIAASYKKENIMKILVQNGAELTPEIKQMIFEGMSKDFSKELEESAIEYKKDQAFKSAYDAFNKLLILVPAAITKQGYFLGMNVLGKIADYLTSPYVSESASQDIANTAQNIYRVRQASDNHSTTIQAILQKENLSTILGKEKQKTYLEQYLQESRTLKVNR